MEDYINRFKPSKEFMIELVKELDTNLISKNRELA